MARLVCCSSCSTYILPSDAACPFCGARQRTVARTAGALAVGLALGGCGDGNPEPEMFESAAAYGVVETSESESETLPPTTEPPIDTSSGSESGASSSEGSSGSTGATTGTGGATDTDTDTDTGGTTLEPDYGVPTTTTSG